MCLIQPLDFAGKIAEVMRRGIDGSESHSMDADLGCGPRYMLRKC